jgi:hypothetical protein
VEEAGNERFGIIVREPKAEGLAIKGHQALERFRFIDIEHDVAKAERTGAKAGDAAPRLERLGRSFRTVKDFQPIAHWIGKHDQVRNMPLVGKGASAARDRYPAIVETRGHSIERRGVGNFPAEKSDAFAAIGMDNHALPAVVHAESERSPRLVHALQAEKTGAIAGPVVESLGADADIT